MECPARWGGVFTTGYLVIWNQKGRVGTTSRPSFHRFIPVAETSEGDVPLAAYLGSAPYTQVGVNVPESDGLKGLG